MRTALFAAVLCLAAASSGRAQTFGDASDEVFADDVLPTIRISIDEDDLATILAPGNVLSDVEYPARFEFESPYGTSAFDSVGFRLRGNTSRHSQKKSFRISFNTFIQGGDWRGLEKLNLNGEHNDPSIVRSKLGWDLFGEFDVPASRATHARLYINGDYFGLYINVEHVDEEFLQRRFAGDEGFLYKCLWPADLRPGSGDACDVQLGADEAAARSRLDAFIATVNSGSRAALERSFDIAGFLRYLAVTVVTGSWDSYWFLKNNFYLYYDPAVERMRMVPYDYDNTFGIWWEGIWPGLDWSTRDVYAWGHPTEDRPLTRRILAIPEFREQYTLYLREVLAGGFTPASLRARALALRDLTAEAAEEDEYRTLDYGFSIQDYHDSYTVALADRNDGQGHVRHGLLPFIDARHSSATAQLDPGNIAPVISNVRIAPDPARPADPVEVLVRVEDEGVPSVTVSYWPDEPVEHVVVATPAPEAGRAMYRATVPPLGFEGTLDIRVSARDDAGAVRVGALIPVSVDDSRPALWLNELMALNSTTLADEFGDFDDWVEVFNAGPETVSLAGLTLSDDASRSDRWMLPDVTVPPGGFLLLWLDGEPDQGVLHGPFRLSGDGESLALYDVDGTALDRVDFGVQDPDVSYGRSTDGTGDWTSFAEPTPGASNTGVTGIEVDHPTIAPIDAWPNPFRDRLRVTTAGPGRIDVYDLLGRRIRRIRVGGTGVAEWDGTDASGVQVAPGVYLVRVEQGAAQARMAVSLPVVRAR